MGPGSLLLYMPETSSSFGFCHLKTTETSAETLTILCKLTLKFMLSSWRKASAYWSYKTDSESTNGQTVNELTGKKNNYPQCITSAMQVRMMRHSLALLSLCSSESIQRKTTVRCAQKTGLKPREINGCVPNSSELPT